ncbi:hypothetical protein VR45_36355 [Streptomyces sp. NRRL S-495]|nr:hypothetical protein VR45_36355 [Streptomyces sp. NRRL S-495]
MTEPSARPSFQAFIESTKPNAGAPCWYALVWAAFIGNGRRWPSLRLGSGWWKTERPLTPRTAVRSPKPRTPAWVPK